MKIQLKLKKPLQDFALLVYDLITDSRNYQAKVPFFNSSHYAWPKFRLNVSDDNFMKPVEVIFEREGASGTVTARGDYSGGTELIVTSYDDQWEPKLKRAWEHLYYELHSQRNWLEEPLADEVYPPWWPENPYAKYEDVIAKAPEEIREWLRSRISQMTAGFSWEDRENLFHIDRLIPLHLRTLDVFGEGSMRPSNGIQIPSWGCLLFGFEFRALGNARLTRVRSICVANLPSQVKGSFEELREQMVQTLGQGMVPESVAMPMSQSSESEEQKSGSMWSWAGTKTKLDNLRHIREQSKVNSKGSGRVTIGRIAACIQAEIDPKTVRKRDPELWARWDDWEY